MYLVKKIFKLDLLVFFVEPLDPLSPNFCTSSILVKNAWTLVFVSKLANPRFIHKIHHICHVCWRKENYEGTRKLSRKYIQTQKNFSYSPFIISLTLSIRQKEARPEKRLTFSDVPLIVPWLDSNFLAETKGMK